jgi:hypothetical protein
MKALYSRIALLLGAVGTFSVQGQTPLPEGVSLLLIGQTRFEGAGMLPAPPRELSNTLGEVSSSAGTLTLNGQSLSLSGSAAGQVSSFSLGNLNLQLGPPREGAESETPLPPQELRPLPDRPLVISGSLMQTDAFPQDRAAATVPARPAVPSRGESDGIIRLDPREWDGTFNGTTPGVNPPRVDTPRTGSAPALPTGAYKLSASVPKMEVGVPVDGLFSLITVLRPSPGDDYWYRLPHTISVQGTLPDGIQLVQKGEGFHQLARFAGTPTRAGTYEVTLQATMADGATTSPLPVVLQVSEFGSFSFVQLFAWGRTRFVAGEAIEGAAALTLVTNRGTPLNAADEGIYAFQVSGLPEGLAYESPRGDGNFVLTGTATEPGNYRVAVQWGPKGGETLARTEVQLEILPAGYVPAKRVLIQSLNRPLKQATLYAAGTFEAPAFFVEDELGRRLETGFTLEAEGLPKGLAMKNPRGGSLSGLAGRPRESGTFSIQVKARFDDGTESEPVAYALQVEPSFDFAGAAGTYDCLLERSAQFNDNNGGRCLVTLSKTGALSGYVINNFKRYPFSSGNVQLDKESGELTIAPPNSGLIFSGGIQEDTQGYSSPDRPVYALSGTLAQKGQPEAFVSLRGLGAPVLARGKSSVFASPHPINLMVVKGSSFDMSGTEQGGPTGIGFSALRISPTGMVTATVWAADGSAPVTSATRLCETISYGARFPAFFALNNSSGRSALMGSLFVNAEGDAAGQMDWYQKATDRGGFPEGIPHLQYEGVIGSRMVPKPLGLNLEGFEEGLRNAELDFEGADGVSEDVIPLTLDSKSIQPALPAAAPSAETKPVASQIRIRYNAGTGVLNGSMVWLDPLTGARRPVTFRGMRAPDGTAVMGHFTAPETAGSKKMEAGQIRIQPSQAAR